MGHIGYISLKTKNIIFFFIIKVFVKTRNYEKGKKSLFQLCTLRLRCLCSVSLQAAAFSPFLWGSCILEVHFGPPTWRSCQPIYIQVYTTGHFCTSGFGVQAATLRISRNRDTPQVRYQVLKRRGFALFQSRFRLVQQKQSLLPVLFVCDCSWKPAFTPHWTWIKELVVKWGSWTVWEDGWPGPRSSLRRVLGFLGAAPALRAPNPPTPTSALLSTCLVLEIRCSPFCFSSFF